MSESPGLRGICAGNMVFISLIWAFIVDKGKGKIDQKCRENRRLESH